MLFEWGKTKEATNKRKHGISIDEAKSVFYDEEALVIYDQSHSMNEEHFVLLGLSELVRELVEIYCERNSNEQETIRIISAVKAESSERTEYWKRKTN